MIMKRRIESSYGLEGKTSPQTRGKADDVG